MITSRPRRSVLVALAVLLAWLAVGGLTGPASGGLAEVQENDNAAFLPEDAESTRAAVLERELGSTDALPTVVVYERRGGLTPADEEAVAADLARLARLPGLAGPPPTPVRSQDGQAVQLVLLLDTQDAALLPEAVDAIRAVIAEPGGPDGYVTGVGGLTADLVEVFRSIDMTLLLATAGVVVLILLVVYRSPVLWILPLLSVGLAFSLAAGVIYPLAKRDVLTLDGTGQGILTVLVFGAGTDYALLLIARYREELHRHERTSAAMLAALRGAVPAIVASAATVVLGLLCLLLSELDSNRGLGPVAAIGILSLGLALTIGGLADRLSQKSRPA